MGRTLVILFGLCAVAYAQFQNTGFRNSGFNQNSRQPQQNQNQYRQNQNQYQQNQYQSQGQQQYSRQQYSQQQQSARQTAGSAGSCREANERSPVSGSCDRYIECINGTAEEKLCPDGLLFNPNVNFNVYPCQYPNEVQCLERSSLQEAQPTELCPHQFAIFRTGDAQNCGTFRNCVNGVGFDQVCPDGLAFNSETYRCDWPDEVADCDAEAFLGFRCPEVPISKELGAPAGYRFYRSDTDCQKYFICIDGRPRALSCGGENAFDELTSSCVGADEVAACPPELRAASAASRDAERQRVAKQVEIDAIPNKNKRRQY